MKRHELSRTRYIQEMPERPYNPKRVYKESPDNWVTFFDVNVKETFRAETVKDIFVRFPVRVVRWDVNPECNMWGLALDGFYRNPSRLEGTMQDTEELAQANTNQVAAE